MISTTGRRRSARRNPGKFHDPLRFQARTLRTVDVLPNFRLRLTYTNGYSGELDFWPYIEWGEAVAPLKNPALFSTAHVGSRGRSLEWIGPDGIEIDFCADALRMELEGLRERPSAAE